MQFRKNVLAFEHAETVKAAILDESKLYDTLRAKYPFNIQWEREEVNRQGGNFYEKTAASPAFSGTAGAAGNGGFCFFLTKPIFLSLTIRRQQLYLTYISRVRTKQKRKILTSSAA